MRRGWPANKVILGLTTNPESASGWVPDDMLRNTIQRLMMRYPDFGGVMGWEVYILLGLKKCQRLVRLTFQ